MLLILLTAMSKILKGLKVIIKKGPLWSFFLFNDIGRGTSHKFSMPHPMFSYSSSLSPTVVFNYRLCLILTQHINNASLFQILRIINC